MKITVACLILISFFAALPAFAEVPSPMLAGDEEMYRAYIAADGIQHVTMIGGNYFFKPRHIIVRANAPVELHVSLERGIVPHSLTLHAPEAGIDIHEKLDTAMKTIRFTPTTPGIYPFYCANKLLFLKSHREKGMEGMLEVVE